MTLTDGFWLLGIVAGTAWLLWRTLRATRGGCAGCSARGCNTARKP